MSGETALASAESHENAPTAEPRPHFLSCGGAARSQQPRPAEAASAGAMSLSVTEQERLATLDECISTCEEAVSLLSAVASPGTKEKLPPRERAKVDAACAYTANALYFGALLPLQPAIRGRCHAAAHSGGPPRRLRRPAAAAYMNTQGVDPKGHPVMEQLVRGARRQRRSGAHLTDRATPRRAGLFARLPPNPPFDCLAQRLVQEMQNKIRQRVRASGLASLQLAPPPVRLRTRSPAVGALRLGQYQESGGTGAATGPEKRTLALDKDAAARLVRHAQGPGQGGGPAK